MPTLPLDFTTQVASSTTAFFGTISPIVIFIGGIILATLVASTVLNIIHLGAAGLKAGYNKISQ